MIEGRGARAGSYGPPFMHTFIHSFIHSFIQGPTYKRRLNCIRFELSVAVKIHVVAFWVLTPCSLIGENQRFRGIYCLHLQDNLAL
jgi:hypothetical protein